MAETLSLTGANGVSEIHIETGLLDHAGTVILETFSPSRVHIVSDSTVAPLYLEKLEKQLWYMVENDYKFSYTAYQEMDNDGRETGVVIRGPKHVSKLGCLRSAGLGA